MVYGQLKLASSECDPLRTRGRIYGSLVARRCARPFACTCKDLHRQLNFMSSKPDGQVRNIARLGTTAVAKGDLSRKDHCRREGGVLA